MKSLVLALMLAASSAFAGQVVEVNLFSDSAELASHVKNVRIGDASFKKLVSKYEVTQAYCGDMECTETRALAYTDVVRVDVAFEDYSQLDEMGPTTWRSFNLPTNLFSAAEIALLKSSPKAFIKNALSLSNVKTAKTVMIVDVANSDLCPIDESNVPNPIPGCTERLVYKPITVWVQAIKISKK